MDSPLGSGGRGSRLLGYAVRALAGRARPLAARRAAVGAAARTPLGVPMHWAARPTPTAGGFASAAAVVGVAGRRRRAALAVLGLRVVEWLPGLRLGRGARQPRRRSRALARSDDPRIRYVEPVIARPRRPRPQRPADLAARPGDRRAVGVAVPRRRRRPGAEPGAAATRASSSGVVDSGVARRSRPEGEDRRDVLGQDDPRSAVDVLGHGTFVSSIIAARNDDGFGLAGFCGACRLAVYKAVPLNDVQVAEGIRTLTDAHVRVINLSIVLNSPSQAVADAIAYATAAGVLVVARERERRRSRRSHYPASLLQPAAAPPSTGLAVGASDRERQARVRSRTRASSSRCSRRGRSTRAARAASSARSPGRDRLRGERRAATCS